MSKRLPVYGRATTVEAQRTPIRDRVAYYQNVGRILNVAKRRWWVK